MNLKSIFWAMSIALTLLVQGAEGDRIIIDKTGGTRTIPISIKGYTPEAERVLTFDLEVMGFRVVPEADAQYTLNGKSDAGQVEGRLNDKISKAQLLAKAYTGGNTRSQAHALSDEIVETILRVPGIARTKIAFKGDSGANSEVFISDYDGYNPIQATMDRSIVAAPAWVPKRLMLFYTSYKSGYPDIYAHSLDSGERSIVSRYPGLNTGAAISPNGQRLAMILSKSGSPDVYVANLDGSGLVQLTKTKEDESSPGWSPDGSQICFAARLNEVRALYVIPSSGGSMRRIRTEGALNPSEPDWSPDGQWIAFTSQTRAGFDICVVPAGGGTAEIICAGEDPSWAPNSRTIIFTKRISGKRTLSLLDVPTRKVKDTAQFSGSRSQPSWAK